MAFVMVSLPSVADPGFGKGGFMCTVATTPPFDVHAHRWTAAVLTASNCRETVSLFAYYASFNGNRGNPSGSATDHDTVYHNTNVKVICM